jgi:hypothetical protein
MKRLFTGNNFAIWADFEYINGSVGNFAMLITYDGINWRLGIGSTDILSYMTHEFSSVNNDISSFESVFRYVPNYNYRIDKFWSTGNVNFAISELNDGV